LALRVGHGADTLSAAKRPNATLIDAGGSLPDLFGYGIEPNFDLSKERRKDRVGWLLIVGTGLCILYDAFGGRFGVQSFQGTLATVLLYGDSFYANRRGDLKATWLWKAVIASIPVHLIYLASLFWCDNAIPGLMMKAIVFIPVIALLFVIESSLVDRIANYFKPARTNSPNDSSSCQ
jgi:hypothetical protein